LKSTIVNNTDSKKLEKKILTFVSEVSSELERD